MKEKTLKYAITYGTDLKDRKNAATRTTQQVASREDGYAVLHDVTWAWYELSIRDDSGSWRMIDKGDND